MCFGSDNSDSNVHPAPYSLADSKADLTLTSNLPARPDETFMRPADDLPARPDETFMRPAGSKVAASADSLGGLTRPMGM